MQRAATSQEFNNNNHHELQEQVISFLEERESTSESCQLLLAEIQMLFAMFEDAKVHFMINSSSNNATAAKSSSGPRKNIKNKGNGNDDDDGSEDTKDVVPAINISVPLRTLQGDGESTLATVLLSIVLEEPDQFPNSSEIAIRFKSPQLSPQIRSDLADSLLQYSKELQLADSLSIGALASRAEEILLGLPVSAQSAYFGCCLNCNKVQLIKGLSKAPAPFRLQMDDRENVLFSKREDCVFVPDDKEDDENNNSHNRKESYQQQQQHQKRKTIQQLLTEEDVKRPLSDKEAGCPTTAHDVVNSVLKKQKQLQETKPNECLMCKSDLIIFVPSMKPTKKTECSFCYCEDHPLISFPNCSCVSCFDCFIRFAEMAVGERKIKRPIFGFMGFGIACPTHPKDSLVNDPGLMKMLPRRSFFRFNAFATKDFATTVGGYVCPNPRCESGLPQVSSLMKTGLTICFYCNAASCLECGHESIGCKCSRLVMSEKTPLREVKDRIFRDNTGGRLPVMCPVYEGDILFVLGKNQKILSVPLDSATWKEHCDAYVWNECVSSSKREYASYIATFNGAPLNPQWPLSRCGVHPGAIVYLIPFFDVDPEDMKSEIELWNFRRAVAKGREDGGAAQKNADEKFLAEVAKPCPKCKAPSLHYRGHHCHHLSCSCGYQWCFNCSGPYPCQASPRCSVFCNETCNCKLCPDCKLMSPCSICMGCPNCQPKIGGEKFS